MWLPPANAQAYQGQALRVTEKISTLQVVFFPKTLTAFPPPHQQELAFFLSKKNNGSYRTSLETPAKKESPIIADGLSYIYNGKSYTKITS
ncbi:hypothetical protein DFR65_104227 [Oceanihabitans sediminis]|uniref:Uncharacterized protein n=1 Tax=Oceanihabitans sediminis TaxID=1812012 RepID=A0A368P3R7_9FLAO|nr:hypothetical protein DFR65_104227 [Oceanihabitans sediminis]RCU56920.1 hypothetical protein DU428_11300 [Oceanihabitans sediminis]